MFHYEKTKEVKLRPYRGQPEQKCKIVFELITTLNSSILSYDQQYRGYNFEWRDGKKEPETLTIYYFFEDGHNYKVTRPFERSKALKFAARTFARYGKLPKKKDILPYEEIKQ